MLKWLMCVAFTAGAILAVAPQTAVAREAAPLTKGEMAEYAQMQAAALDNDVLVRGGGYEMDNTTLLIIAGVVIVVAALCIWVF